MRPTDPVTTERTTTPGRLAFGRVTDADLTGLVGGRVPRVLPVPDAPWRLDGDLFVVVVCDDASHLGTLDAAQRGADVVVDVVPERLSVFTEDVARLGIPIWRPPVDLTVHEWMPLLDALATGATTEEAARRCNLSLRSAHRRLAAARAALGVSTTAAAVARWAASARDRLD
jgi:hypothetical protein